MFVTIDSSSECSDPSASLRAILRPAPTLTPEDSVSRFLQVSRRQALSSAPILHQGRIVGIVGQEQIASLFSAATDTQTQSILHRPLSTLMTSPEVVASPQMSQGDVWRLCRERSLGLIEAVPVVDESGFCLGIIQPCDLLLPPNFRPRPATIGGMATPFGVYLTDGNLQAGAGNLALIASGAFMALMLILGMIVGRGMMLGLSYLLHMPNAQMFDPDYSPSLHQPMLGLISLGVKALMVVPFFVLMRWSILAGYHAAEHQTVHAIERDEPLVADVVARMPRVHPRCGTNLMAAASLFFGLSSLLRYVLPDAHLVAVFAALTTLFTWRTFGSFLQDRFTTRTANSRQLASGISAGNELLAKFSSSPPRRPMLLRRIWCLGVLQSLIGLMLASTALAMIAKLFGLDL